MEARLPKTIFKTLRAAINHGEKLPLEISDIVAASMKDWALERGATHYAHIFQPLTGSTSRFEKHDSFYEPKEGQAKTMARPSPARPSSKANRTHRLSPRAAFARPLKRAATPCGT